MRPFDRDLIRGGHYGQRSCEPHLKAEHMAAPTNAANVKKALANSEPSTHEESSCQLGAVHTWAQGADLVRRRTSDATGAWAVAGWSCAVFQPLAISIPRNETAVI